MNFDRIGDDLGKAYVEGYQKGFEDGYKKGFEEGYQKVLKEQKLEITNGKSCN